MDVPSAHTTSVCGPMSATSSRSSNWVSGSVLFTQLMYASPSTSSTTMTSSTSNSTGVPITNHRLLLGLFGDMTFIAVAAARSAMACPSGPMELASTSTVMFPCFLLACPTSGRRITLLEFSPKTFPIPSAPTSPASACGFSAMTRWTASSLVAPLVMRSNASSTRLFPRAPCACGIRCPVATQPLSSAATNCDSGVGRSGPEEIKAATCARRTSCTSFELAEPNNDALPCLCVSSRTTRPLALLPSSTLSCTTTARWANPPMAPCPTFSTCDKASTAARPASGPTHTTATVMSRSQAAK
mmetsp:Transcript_7228/g.45105  ORF Transcript_7228/g.45105 Transcript_7228/m.45105 type:complete len:300 (-) Transcript_7228:1754-2653(-)